MAYIKTTWVNGSTSPINATNLNKIEDGIFNNDAAISSINTNFQPYKMTDSSGNPLNFSTSNLNSNVAPGWFGYGASITNAPTTSAGILYVYRRTTAYVFQVATSNADGKMYKRNSTDTGATWSAWSSLGGVDGLSANMAVYGDASGLLVSSATVSTTELEYLNGVTSAIQTQLNGKMGGTKTISASQPTGGASGDIWFVV